MLVVFEAGVAAQICFAECGLHSGPPAAPDRGGSSGCAPVQDQDDLEAQGDCLQFRVRVTV